MVAAIKCRSSSKEITSLYFCEVSSVLYVGKRDGEVESYIASTSFSSTSATHLELEVPGGEDLVNPVGDL